MDPLFEVDLDRAAIGSRASARSLYLQLMAAIVDGRLMLGAKLPPTRQAKKFFGVSRNTAAEVYEKLKSDGYVVTRHGSGTFVATAVPASRHRSRKRADDAPDRRLNAMWLRPDVTAAMAFWRDDSERLPCTSESDHIDFR